ncbi:hypothetical protein DL89DRAFT_156642 [Linderina pennispora]|uniref:Uncharacterized protein n=1 Tax=Linderina pennispora TaxID=61395 RepID=A0A1Y1VUZ4_9FUNG|nr:uncharacterized protein DL89DRAFT_156642 [Linderina pennispora]ORX64836.1 hypothetical protein DL89DRAFT_156642 [Linderina pennispora]
MQDRYAISVTWVALGAFQAVHFLRHYSRRAHLQPTRSLEQAIAELVRYSRVHFVQSVGPSPSSLMPKIFKMARWRTYDMTTTPAFSLPHLSLVLARSAAQLLRLTSHHTSSESVKCVFPRLSLSPSLLRALLPPQLLVVATTMILTPLSLSSSILASPASLVAMVAMAAMGVLVSPVVRAALAMVDRATADRAMVDLVTVGRVTAALAMAALAMVALAMVDRATADRATADRAMVVLVTVDRVTAALAMVDLEMVGRATAVLEMAVLVTVGRAMVGRATAVLEMAVLEMAVLAMVDRAMVVVLATPPTAVFPLARSLLSPRSLRASVSIPLSMVSRSSLST